ncbi:MAG TPA: 16S rRNA (cytidine(1402)-2'-O)-methyltransferase [Vicinamibacterales bacterium]|nr:16S rRNA (cytidine(1402)-2'-O)-methyltransferase [Vicinamibacterales bacterium]
MPGTLYVVATPIGNLEDITLRALRVLREVQLIAAEDTRRTAKLLQHYSIGTPATSVREHNEARQTPHLIQRLLAGESVALVSDAGTPLVSDPGARLVRAAREAGVPVVAVPGASAVLTALAASGFEADQFTFLGFPPRKATALTRWIQDELATAVRPVVFFEAPHRIRNTLTILNQVLGDRPILVGRELTKRFESSVLRPISVQLGGLSDPKGEFTVVVPPSVRQAVTVGAPPDPAKLACEVGELTKNGEMSVRAAAKVVATRYGLTPNQVYSTVKVRKRLGE